MGIEKEEITDLVAEIEYNHYKNKDVKHVFTITDLLAGSMISHAIACGYDIVIVKEE